MKGINIYLKTTGFFIFLIISISLISLKRHKFNKISIKEYIKLNNKKLVRPITVLNS